jgi:polyphosphate:AMP phosphotransferase
VRETQNLRRPSPGSTPHKIRFLCTLNRSDITIFVETIGGNRHFYDFPAKPKTEKKTMRLNKLDLQCKIDKTAYKAAMPKLELNVGELQRKLREQGVPVIIVFEGWGAAGKGTQINNLMLSLDPRGLNVNLTKAPNEEEYMRPFLWRFWLKLPAGGRIAIFDRSWYRRVLHERVEKIITRKDWRRAYDEINTFERQLTDDGAVIVKFFLHISKKEQKKRFEALIKNPATAWKVSKNDWKQHKNYNKFVEVIEDMLSHTSNTFAPWTVVEADDHRFASVKIMKTLIAALSRAGAVRKTAAPSLAGKVPLVLDKTDTSATMTKETYEEEIKKYQSRLRELEHEIYVKRIPVLIVYEGWDAAGKGGNIRRLAQALDPRGYEVVPVAAPNDVEKSHHYLWRFWQKVPKAGHITIFDRSWYGRVMVERIEGFCGENEWKRAYGEICEFETNCADFGMVMIKFWLHISQDEQLRRFKQRQTTPYKVWKITEEDWRNRKKWDKYKEAVDEMIFRTSTKDAPWTVVEANNKYYARIKAIKTVITAIEKKL